jgi:hypothetical protein
MDGDLAMVPIRNESNSEVIDWRSEDRCFFRRERVGMESLLDYMSLFTHISYPKKAGLSSFSSIT